MVKMFKKENIYNVPNFLTLLRIILTVVIVFLILYDFEMNLIILIFLFAAFTDFMDGYFARSMGQVTRFGTAFDPIADRILLAGTALALILHQELYILFFIFTREFVALPALLFFKNGDIKFEVLFIGKATMFMQSITLPIVLLGFKFGWIFVVVTAVIGFFSGIAYFKQALKTSRKNKPIQNGN